VNRLKLIVNQPDPKEWVEISISIRVLEYIFEKVGDVVRRWRNVPSVLDVWRTAVEVLGRAELTWISFVPAHTREQSIVHFAQQLDGNRIASCDRVQSVGERV
jgi:hypothetical protein